MYNIDEYQVGTVSTSIYKPEKGEIFLLGLGINEEAGEVAGKIKKHFRDNLALPYTKEQIALELGDVMWYASRIAAYFDLKMSEILAKNEAKLADRRARNVISGSGDNR